MQIFGHRGAPGFPRRCENTLGSFRRALECGADGIELDVRRCGDGQIVVIHDATIDRTTNGSGLVSAFTYDQLRQFDAGDGEPAPLLAHVLDDFARRCIVHIEFKESGLLPDVLRLIVERGVQDAIAFSAFDHDDARAGAPAWDELHSAVPTVSTGLLATPSKVQRIGVEGYIRAASRLNASALHVARQAVDRDLVELAHAAGLAVRVFTVNALDEVRHFQTIGADAIFTDFPEQARSLVPR